MSVVDTLEQTLHMPSGETVRRLHENGIVIADEDTMAGAIHDIYCGITADHDGPNEKDRTQARSMVEAVQKRTTAAAV
jgi:hypothetical protein